MCLLDTYELSERWKCSKQHILKLITDNKLRFYKQFKKSGYYVFDLEDVKKSEEILRYKVMRRYGIPQFLEEYTK